MKKKIKGTVYNTETAQELGARDNGVPSTDPSFCVSKLYRTRYGDHFLDIACGPDSEFARINHCDDWIQLIVPMTINEAQAWADYNLSNDPHTIRQFFGGRSRYSYTWVTYELPAECALNIKCMAAAQGMTEAELIAWLVCPRC